MSRIKLATETSTNEITSSIFEEIKKAKGFVPGPYRAFALQEHILQANWHKTKQISTKGTIPALLKEQIALAVSYTNQCHYCIHLHSDNLRKKGLSEEEIDATKNAHSTDLKTKFVLAFVSKATKDAHAVTDEDFNTLRTFGYTDKDILEILTIMEMYTGYNKIVTALDIQLDD